MGGELGELALEALRGQRARIAGDRERCAGCAGPDLADGCGSWGCGEHMFDILESPPDRTGSSYEVSEERLSLAFRAGPSS